MKIEVVIQRDPKKDRFNLWTPIRSTRAPYSTLFTDRPVHPRVYRCKEPPFLLISIAVHPHPVAPDHHRLMMGQDEPICEFLGDTKLVKASPLSFLLQSEWVDVLEMRRFPAVVRLKPPHGAQLWISLAPPPITQSPIKSPPSTWGPPST